jgi:hypothetical protein
VVADEAYAEFADSEHALVSLQLRKQFANLVVPLALALFILLVDANERCCERSASGLVLLVFALDIPSLIQLSHSA